MHRLADLEAALPVGFEMPGCLCPWGCPIRCPALLGLLAGLFGGILQGCQQGVQQISEVGHKDGAEAPRQGSCCCKESSLPTKGLFICNAAHSVLKPSEVQRLGIIHMHGQMGESQHMALQSTAGCMPLCCTNHMVKAQSRFQYAARYSGEQSTVHM